MSFYLEELDGYIRKNWDSIREMLVFTNEGYEWVVDIDLEKFFDNVPQDKLMSLMPSN